MERLSWIIWVGPISLQVFFEGRARSFLVMEHLKIHCCHYSGPGHCCGMDFILAQELPPSVGTAKK